MHLRAELFHPSNGYFTGDWLDAPSACCGVFDCLTKLCEAEFQWKRTTTYTMLKRLCDRGLFANEGGCVVVKTSMEDFRGAQGEQFLEDTFEGSLPKFLAAFSRRRKLKEKEIEELKKLIEENEEE